MNRRSFWKEWSPASLWFGVTVLAGLCLAMISWYRWANILVDFGRELYLPWRIVSGDVIGRDVSLEHGAFSPLFNAFLFKVFGVSFTTLAAFHLCSIAVLVWFFYSFFLKRSDRVTAVLVSLTFVCVSAFRGQNCNFVAPYSYSLPHGIMLSFFVIWILGRWARKQNLWWIATAGLLTGVIFLTKVEVFLALSVTALAALVFVYRDHHFSIVKTTGLAGTFLGAMVLPAAGLFAYLSSFLSFEEAAKQILIQYRQVFQSDVTSNVFYQSMTGIQNARFYTGKIVVVTGLYLLFALSVAGTGYLLTRIRQNGRRAVLIGLAAVVAAATVLYGGNVGGGALNLWLPIAFPVVVFFICLYWMARVWRDRRDREVFALHLPMFLFSLFGLVLLAKIICRVQLDMYGFALAMPALLMVVTGAVYVLPRLLAARYGHYGVFQYVTVLAVAVFLVLQVNFISLYYFGLTFDIGPKKDRIVTWDRSISPVGDVVSQTLAYLEKHVCQDETFLVIPEGVMLNYQTRRRNSTPYTAFLLVHFAMHGEASMIKNMKKSPPDYVVLIDRGVSEFGYKKFGVDTGILIADWVRRYYTPVERYGVVPFMGVPYSYGTGAIIAKRGKPPEGAWSMWP